MMDYQAREKSYELKVFEALAPRMDFEEEVQENFLRLQDDFEAKAKVDQYTRELRLCCSVRYDLALTTKQGTNAHIDTLILTQDTIHFYLIKNLIGHYRCKGNAFWNEEAGSLYNPSASFKLLKKQLDTMGDDLEPKRKVMGHLVFPNANFSLENPSPHYSILLEDTMEEHFQTLLANELKHIYEYYRK